MAVFLYSKPRLSQLKLLKRFLVPRGNIITLHTHLNNCSPTCFQGAQSLVWWWLMCGATCHCWTTGTWCPGWLCPAADTTAWCTTASSTPSEDWASLVTWTTWRGKLLAKSTAVNLQTADTCTVPYTCEWFCKRRWMLSNPVGANKYSRCTAKRGRWYGMQQCGAAYCKSGWTGFFCESKRCRGTNLSRSNLNGHSCECCYGATEPVLLSLEWRIRERIRFLRVEWCTVSDSIHFSIITSLQLKVVNCGPFSLGFSSYFSPVFV